MINITRFTQMKLLLFESKQKTRVILIAVSI